MSSPTSCCVVSFSRTLDSEARVPSFRTQGRRNGNLPRGLASQPYALNLSTSTIDKEMEKREKHAELFGIAPPASETDAAGTEEKDDEAMKVLEQAKRFDTGRTAMGKPNEALPLEREKKRRAESSTMDDPGLSNKRRRGPGGRRGGRDKNRGDRPMGVTKLAPAYVSEKDRLVAEARKKKFAIA